MAVIQWELTPWYLRFFAGRPRWRRRMAFSNRTHGWQYYDENIHGRGLWV